MKIPRWMWWWIVLGWIALLVVAVVDAHRIERLQRELKAAQETKP